MPAIHIHDDQVRRLHHAFAHGGWGGKNVAVVQPHRKIAIHRGHVAALVQSSAKKDNFPTMLAFTWHGLRGWERQPRLNAAYGNPVSWRLQTLLHSITFLMAEIGTASMPAGEGKSYNHLRAGLGL